MFGGLFLCLSGTLKCWSCQRQRTEFFTSTLIAIYMPFWTSNICQHPISQKEQSPVTGIFLFVGKIWVTKLLGRRRVWFSIGCLEMELLSLPNYYCLFGPGKDLLVECDCTLTCSMCGQSVDDLAGSVLNLLILLFLGLHILMFVQLNPSSPVNY